MTLNLRPGGALLVPYLTGAITPDWTDHLLACQDAGADAVEVGLPFSDPMLDGTTIQLASDRALARGATPAGILDDLAAVRDRLTIPVVVMTYANLALRLGPARLATAGVSGLIVPDLPLEESEELEAASAAAGVDLVLLAAPSTPDDRLREICRRSRGFVYAVSTMGTTGERARLDPAAAVLATRLRRAVRDARPPLSPPDPLPVLVGFGVSTPEQAAEAGRAGDGVIVGAALMRRVLDGATPAELRRDVAALRAALGVPRLPAVRGAEAGPPSDQGVSTATAYAEVPGDRR
ncbi:tryptophan synthase subunit alpha [Actinoplanes sp. RD1]|uniref:tryptophan synthase subunit alpha n=1 Tax=Actinoplanes sp. RD1 TaxID=3064538 RepID=UPI0027407BA6|nr:tryptophan synthase subunit alpha [Actinoplanes sp. RD1]